MNIDNLDYTGQCNHLAQLADGLTSCNWEGTPEEIVNFWEGEQKRLDTGYPGEGIPAWYDEDSHNALVAIIEDIQKREMI